MHLGQNCVIISLLGFFTKCQVHQLQHELSKKDELLRIVASATEENETDSGVSTALQPVASGATTAAAALSQLEFLRNKLQDLEEENLVLRSEVRVNTGKLVHMQRCRFVMVIQSMSLFWKHIFITYSHCRHTVNSYDNY